MGVVFLALHPEQGPAALKFVRAAGTAGDDESFRARFGREIEAARRVRSPRAARVLAADPDATVPWLATAFVDGPTLQEAIDESGPMSGERLVSLAVALADALAVGPRGRCRPPRPQAAQHPADRRHAGGDRLRHRLGARGAAAHPHRRRPGHARVDGAGAGAGPAVRARGRRVRVGRGRGVRRRREGAVRRGVGRRPALPHRPRASVRAPAAAGARRTRPGGAGEAPRPATRRRAAAGGAHRGDDRRDAGGSHRARSHARRPHRRRSDDRGARLGRRGAALPPRRPRSRRADGRRRRTSAPARAGRRPRRAGCRNPRDRARVLVRRRGPPRRPLARRRLPDAVGRRRRPGLPAPQRRVDRRAARVPRHPRARRGRADGGDRPRRRAAGRGDGPAAARPRPGARTAGRHRAADARRPGGRGRGGRVGRRAERTDGRPCRRRCAAEPSAPRPGWGSGSPTSGRPGCSACGGRCPAWSGRRRSTSSGTPRPRRSAATSASSAARPVGRRPRSRSGRRRGCCCARCTPSTSASSNAGWPPPGARLPATRRGGRSWRPRASATRRRRCWRC